MSANSYQEKMASISNQAEGIWQISRKLWAGVPSWEGDFLEEWIEERFRLMASDLGFDLVQKPTATPGDAP